MNTGDGSLCSDKQSKTQRTVPCVRDHGFQQVFQRLFFILLHLPAPVLDPGEDIAVKINV